jgi:hypothetical protein
MPKTKRRLMTRSIADIAIERGLSYSQAYGRALKGEFGLVQRAGGRLVITEGPAGVQRSPAAARQVEILVTGAPRLSD